MRSSLSRSGAAIPTIIESAIEAIQTSSQQVNALEVSKKDEVDSLIKFLGGANRPDEIGADIVATGSKVQRLEEEKKKILAEKDFQCKDLLNTFKVEFKAAEARANVSRESNQLLEETLISFAKLANTILENKEIKNFLYDVLQMQVEQDATFYQKVANWCQSREGNVFSAEIKKGLAVSLLILAESTKFQFYPAFSPVFQCIDHAEFFMLGYEVAKAGNAIFSFLSKGIQSNPYHPINARLKLMYKVISGNFFSIHSDSRKWKETKEVVLLLMFLFFKDNEDNNFYSLDSNFQKEISGKITEFFLINKFFHLVERDLTDDDKSEREFVYDIINLFVKHVSSIMKFSLVIALIENSEGQLTKFPFVESQSFHANMVGLSASEAVNRARFYFSPNGLLANLRPHSDLLPRQKNVNPQSFDTYRLKEKLKVFYDSLSTWQEKVQFLKLALNPETELGKLARWNKDQLSAERNKTPKTVGEYEKQLKILQADYGHLLVDHFDGVKEIFNAMLAIYNRFVGECKLHNTLSEAEQQKMLNWNQFLHIPATGDYSSFADLCREADKLEGKRYKRLIADLQQKVNRYDVANFYRATEIFQTLMRQYAREGINPEANEAYKLWVSEEVEGTADHPHGLKESWNHMRVRVSDMWARASGRFSVLGSSSASTVHDDRDLRASSTSSISGNGHDDLRASSASENGYDGLRASRR